MNVTFHVFGSIATAAVLSLRKDEKTFSSSTLIKYSIGFITGILIHGLLDYLPHDYPFPSKLDIIFGLCLLTITLFRSKKQNYLIVLACFSGSLFPDIIDLGPAIANKHFGVMLPQFSFKVFPWHWKEFSGSIYDASRRFESNLYHLIFVLLCSILIFLKRKELLSV